VKKGKEWRKSGDYLWKQLWYASLRRAQGEVEGEGGLEPLFSFMDEDEDKATASDSGTYNFVRFSHSVINQCQCQRQNKINDVHSKI